MMNFLGYNIAFFLIVIVAPLTIFYILYRAVRADNFIPPNTSFWDYIRDVFFTNDMEEKIKGPRK